MNNKPVSLEYTNGVMYELEKAFWDERGRGARFRTTTVGRQYFRERCLPLLQSTNMDEILAAVEDLLRRDGIAEDVSRTSEDRLLRVRVQGCVHRSVEDKMISQGIEPFTCIPANVIALALEERLDRPVELAEIKLEPGVCQLLMVQFDKRPSLD